MSAGARVVASTIMNAHRMVGGMHVCPTMAPRDGYVGGNGDTRYNGNKTQNATAKPAPGFRTH